MAAPFAPRAEGSDRWGVGLLYTPLYAAHIIMRAAYNRPSLMDSAPAKQARYGSARGEQASLPRRFRR